MRIPEEALALIRRFEGFSPTPYRCPAGYWTIGYGHVLMGNRPAHSSIPREEAEQLLVADVAIAAAAVRRLIVAPLNDHQRAALISFTFNLGAGALQRSTLRAKINRAEHDAVPREWMRWVYAGGRKLPGLVRRRAEEIIMYQNIR